MFPQVSSGQTSNPNHFPQTRWTLLLAAQREAGSVRELALEELLGRYWKPIYCYVRRKGLSPDAAQDVVQGLYARLLERDFLRHLDPARGRLRAYLRAAADNFLASQWTHLAAAKRGGLRGHRSLEDWEDRQLLATAPHDAAAAFDREWALSVMDRAVARLGDEFKRGVRGARSSQGSVFLRFFGLGQPISYADAARDSGLTVVQFKAALHRARVRFRELVREEVEATTDGDPDGETRYLLQLLRG